jgi:hypothetical protein
MNGELECCCTLTGKINCIGNISGAVSGKATLTGNVSGESTLSGEVQIYNASAPPDYTGGYEVTPSQQEQVLPTANTMVARNIIVNPIPEYYGLITWDGAVLTVS